MAKSKFGFLFNKAKNNNNENIYKYIDKWTVYI